MKKKCIFRAAGAGGKRERRGGCNGRLMGSFVITAVSENGSEINRDGTARAISFSMTLKKVSDSALGVKGVALQLAVTLARGLTGI
ncbi:MAG: hypothetical protein D8H97_22140 [Neisseria sp.]|nr:MAG: hypothetical protein D8H97_22140 [Neisseria sp.]